MAFNLGIDLDGARVVAAVERAGTIRMVSLGRTGRAMRPAVHIDADGDVIVGDDAVERGGGDPEGLVADVFAWVGDGAEHRVNGWAVTGEVLAAHVFAFVVRRAARPDEELGRATITAPPSWPASRVQALRTGAGQAGMVDVEVVDRDRAVERAPSAVSGDAARAGAVGAAVLAAARRRSVAPTTALPPVADDAVPVPDPVTGAIAATSVFAADLPDFEAASPPTVTGGSFGAGGDDWSPPGGSDDGGFEPPDRDRLPFYIAGGVLAALLVVLALVLLLRDGGDGDDTATDGGTSTSSTSTSSTSTSSTSTTSTTTTTSTTVPGTTTTSTTTTIPRVIGKAGLLESGLVMDYGTSLSSTLTFGDDALETLAVLQAALGGPDADTSWRNDPECSGTQSRRVTWGDLEIVFLEVPDGDAPDALRTFEQWFVGAPGTIPPGLSTLERVGVGSTVADLRYAYPNLDISHPISGERTGFFTTQPEGNDLIAGFTSDTTDTAKVQQMWAGAACQRLADSD